MTGSLYRINAPLVANEVVDGEAVIIHFESGSYYSADKLGALLFSRFEKGADVDQLIDALDATFDTPRDEIAPAVQAFVKQLVDDALIVPTETAAPPEPFDGSDLMTFECPTLQKYTDLQDLLLLDPIHDIEQEGWPVAKPKQQP
jgi:hypothetical protein